jgi:hypothetical protein
MITSDIEALRNWILAHNKYLDTGFADAWQDPTSGLIAVGEKERISVALDDHFGNYFYIRVNEEISYSASRDQLTQGIISQDETARCYLVAFVRGAAPKELVRCLLNSLIRYPNEYIRPVKSLVKREQVIVEELKAMDKGELEQILSRLDDLQAVRIEFQLTTIFRSVNDNCPCNPCPKCAIDE